MTDAIRLINRHFLETDDEEEACRLLFNTYYKKIFNTVNRMLSDCSDPAIEADDITSEALTKAFTKRKTLRDPDKLEGWLVTIARCLTIDKVRRHKALHRKLSVVSLSESESNTDLASIRAETDRQEVENAQYEVNRLRHLVAAEERALIDLRLDGLATKEIAESLGLRPGTVRKRWERLRKWLCPIARHLDNLINCLPDANDRKVMERYLEGQALSEIGVVVGLLPSGVAAHVEAVIKSWKAAVEIDADDPVSAMASLEPLKK